MSAFAATAWAWLTDYPSTNGRIFASTVLAVIYVLAIVACLVANRKLDLDAMERLQWFLFGMMVADVGQYVGKRATYKRAGPDADSAPPPGEAPTP